MEDLILKVFENKFNMHIQIIGRARTRILIKGAIQNEVIEYHKSKRGANLDVGEYVHLSFTIIQVIASIVQIIDFYKSIEKNVVKKQDIIEKLNKEAKNGKIEIEESLKGDYEKIIEELLNEDK